MRTRRWNIVLPHMAFVVAIFTAATLFSCITSQGQEGAPVREGWIDDDTYRIHAEGATKNVLTNKTQRKMAAKQAALLNAQSRINEKLMGAITEYYARVDDYCVPTRLSAEVMGAIRGGTVLDERFDDQDTCTILYEVKYPGLKKKVTPPLPCAM